MKDRSTNLRLAAVRPVLILLMLLAMTVMGNARTRQVFFAGGQSNAKPEWAAAIEETLVEAGGPDVLVVHQYHPGHWLQDWYTTEPQADYTNDFFNTAGTGHLQAQLQAIKAAGDDYVFNGFFWFQGEGDTGDNATMDTYNGRFFAMLGHLKQDLGLTNDFNSTLAVIDLNQDPFYDNPANAAGRTRADIEKMRMIQFAIASTTISSSVDTRSYARMDAWHVTSSELTRLGTNMANVHVTTFGLPWGSGDSLLVNGGFESGIGSIASGWNKAEFGPFVVPSDGADGTVFERLGTNGTVGAFSTQDLIVGSAAGPANYGGIAFFPLPARSFSTASLALTVVVGGVLSNANVDVWGLGYVTGTPALNGNWFLNADTDTRTGAALGTGIGTNTPVKIADNIVTQGTGVSAGTRWQTDSLQGNRLKDFLNSLQASGAMPGDYAVIRVNPDADVAAAFDGTAGHAFQSIRYGGSHRIAPDQRAQLSLTPSSDPLIAERSTDTPRDGAAAFRFGLDATHHGTNLTWITQDLNAGDVSGRRITFSGYCRHSSTNPLLANQQIEFQLLCRNTGDDTLSTVHAVALDSTAPQDLYQFSTLHAVAPTGTVQVSVQVIFRAPDFLTQTAGSVLVDDVTLTISASQEPEFPITRIDHLLNGDIRLKWASISNRQYVVQATTNLFNTPFGDLPGTNIANATELNYTNHPSARAQFYRVRRLP